MVRSLVIAAVVGCAVHSAHERLTRVVDALADDNYALARREPALVEMKLRKMQRGPYEWMRGTAALYWSDLVEPGEPRAVYRASDHSLSDGVDWPEGGAPAGMSYGRSPTIFGPFVTGSQTPGAANP